MISALIEVLAPVFITIGLGYAWTRRGIAFPTDFVARFVATIGVSCLIFSVLSTIDVDPAAIGRLLVAALVLYAGIGAVALLIVMAGGLAKRVYLPALMFPNTGNLGLGVCLFAFGNEGLALGIIIFTVAVALQYTLGVSIAAGHASLHRIVREPAVYAVIISLGVLIIGWTPPKWLHNTTSLIGGATIPLMLLALGVSLGKLQVGSLRRSIVLSSLRIVSGFALAWVIADFFDLAGPARGILILQASMPVAVFNYLFALRYGNEPENVASVVLVSTLIGLALLPLILIFVMG